MVSRQRVPFIFLLILLAVVFCEGSIPDVYAVVKSAAELSCDISPATDGDSILLVVWYKDDMTPIYSYDGRMKNNEADRHWRDEDVFGGRVRFRTITEPAKLSIENIQESDAGLYRCRVDFQKSQTKNQRMRLIVIVPPEKVSIIDVDGNPLLQSVAGPYQEGEEMTLLCVVTGGRPPPAVKWWRGETLVDATDKPSPFPDVMHNKLTVSRLTRDDLHSEYTCQASNTNITSPVQTSITVTMNLKPLSVKILSSNNPFSADRPITLACQSVGSTPPAKITWWKDNKQLHNSTESVSADGNVTTSKLTLVPNVDDNGKRLTCRADNRNVAAGAEEDSIELNIYYVPIIRLELGSSLRPDSIREGTDVYFECKIKTNPATYKVIWKHNGVVIQHNPKNGIILNDRALALQSVRKDQAGAYSCVAFNVEGDGTSNVVNLKVMYKPICRLGQKHIYGVSRNEETKILCEVESSPPPSSFRWSFNNTAEIVDVPETRIHMGTRYLSTLAYKPATDMDYGTVMCWASNAAGQQTDPCVFHIIAAGHPDAPFNCSLLNQTTKSLEVECMPGFDGGERQWFVLEARDTITGQVVANLSNKLAAFSVADLGPGQNLRIAVTAVNNKGRSDAVYLDGFTLKVAEKQTGTPAALDFAPVLGYLLAGSLILLAMALVALVAWRRSQIKGPNRPLALPLKDKVALPLRADVDDLYELEDKNPDVVPNNKDSDYQLASEAGTPATNGRVDAFNEHTLKRHPPTRNGGIYDNFKQSNERLANRSLNSPNEVTYAELCMTQPVPIESKTKPPPLLPRTPDTVYASIDYSRRVPPETLRSPISPTAPRDTTNARTPLTPATSREIVTVRTPLMGHQQESCV